MADFFDTLLLITWFVASAAFITWVVRAWVNTRGRNQ